MIAFRFIDAAIARPGVLPEGLDVRRLFEGLPGVRPLRARHRVHRRSRPAGATSWRGVPSERRWAMEVLGLHPGMAVERDDVQKRFRRLVRLAHPDHGAGKRGRGRTHRRARRGAGAAARRRSLRPARRDARDSFAQLWQRHPVHVTVTGAAGQIGYALVHRIATGQLLGPDQPVVSASARDRARDAGARRRRHGARRRRAPAARRHRGHRRPRRPRSTARRGRCSSAPSRARRAWSAATCSRSTAGSSSRRARRSTTTPRATSACSWSATRATRTASSPARTRPTSPPTAGSR